MGHDNWLGREWRQQSVGGGQAGGLRECPPGGLEPWPDPTVRLRHSAPDVSNASQLDDHAVVGCGSSASASLRSIAADI